jgi:hypothetical protein
MQAVAGAALDEARGLRRLQPADIPRVRLFLCHESDAKDGKLPQVHVEVDPCTTLSIAVADLQRISRSSKLAPSKPHSGHRWYVVAVHVRFYYESPSAAYFQTVVANLESTEHPHGPGNLAGLAVTSLFLLVHIRALARTVIDCRFMKRC